MYTTKVQEQAVKAHSYSDTAAVIFIKWSGAPRTEKNVQHNRMFFSAKKCY